MEFERIEGADRGRIVLYALSTCQWCRRTKELLSELGVAFSYIYVDLLEEDEMKGVIDDVTKYNPRGSFPVIRIGDKVIVGFHEEEIREALA
ncbi:MAG: glutaredoxin family protein [Methanomicrobiaceae archaeon]|nr:glutaredoxin family protein [Methanomicrobiaceae archaeon]